MQAANSDFYRTVKSNASLNWLLILLLAPLSILAAYLLVNGQWQFALAALLVLPGIILLSRYPWLGVALWLLVDPFLLQTPTAIERRMFWVIHRALPPLTLLIILASSALKISPRKLPKLGLPELAMAGYLIAGLFSIWMLNGTPLATSYLFYDRVFIPMCLYLIVRFTIRDGESAQKLLPVLVFLSLSQSIIGIVSWYVPQYLPSEWLTLVGDRTIGSLVNPSVYTTTLIFSSLVVLHAGLNSKSRWFKGLAVVTFLLAFYCIFISFTRASWIAGMVVLLGLLFVYPRFILKTGLAIMLFILVLGGSLLANQVQWAQERLNSPQSERSALSRLPVYYASVRMIEAKPILGWGYGNFDEYDRRFQARVPGYANDNKDHASHNLYLTTAAEQGLLGLILFVTPVIWLLILSFRVFPRMAKNGFWDRKLLIILWLVILSNIAVNSFTNMRVVFGLGTWWITLGLIASLVYGVQKPKPNSG